MGLWAFTTTCTTQSHTWRLVSLTQCPTPSLMLESVSLSLDSQLWPLVIKSQHRRRLARELQCLAHFCTRTSRLKIHRCQRKAQKKNNRPPRQLLERDLADPKETLFLTQVRGWLCKK